MTRRRSWWLGFAVALLIAISVLFRPAPERVAGGPAIEDDGTVHVPAFDMPPSALASPGAAEYFVWKYRLIKSSVRKLDWGLSKFYEVLIARQHARYAVDIKPLTLGGVPTEEFLPKEGIAPSNRDRVLINLHGGGFVMGAIVGGRVESIPIASVGKIRVVSVDYRQGPWHHYPAATQDIATVYQELLKQYQPKNIGIYGCSAGGFLGAEAAAWFQKENIPRPGALGLFGAGAGTARGDSWFLASALTDTGYGKPKKDGTLPQVAPLYFWGADANDPLVAPVVSPAVLAKFPPTLLISGTRAPELSAVAYDHTQLVKAGATAKLHVWEGMDHCFLYDPDLPESREAYDVIVNFFQKYLGQSDEVPDAADAKGKH